MEIPSKIDFKNPRQREWGIIQGGSLVQLNYGGTTDSTGVAVISYSTNCYSDMLEQAKIILAKGTGSVNIQAIEFIPYDYLMQPRS